MTTYDDWLTELDPEDTERCRECGRPIPDFQDICARCAMELEPDP